MQRSVGRLSLAAAAGAGLVPFLAAPGGAVVLAVATTTLPQAASDGQKYQLALDDSGHNTLDFQGSGLTVFTFNAVCSVMGPAGSRLLVRITVDNHPTDPNAPDLALCAPSGTNPENYTAVTRSATFTFDKNRVHTVRVYATGLGTAQWRLDDAFLSVQQ